MELRREIIGLDFKNLRDREEFQINFLLDTSKINFNEVIKDLSDAFNTVINNFIEGNTRNDNQLILDEVDRKYSLGTRILVMGLSNYPISKSNSPTIRYLGNRVILLYIKDFINELVDVKQVILDMADSHDISEEQIEKARIEKFKKRGGFEKGIILERIKDKEGNVLSIF